MMRIVVDTNVIVSALVFGGIPRRVLELAESGECELFYSETIQAEVRRVLGEKFGWAPSVLQEVLMRLWDMGELVVTRTTVKVIRDDPDDDRILECALAARADFIVSGDRHLLALSSHQSISIVTPRQFLQNHLAKRG
ncbi:MAG TPA: putative toxin-antitoxin system toxin component, PIN family [Candidatus Sulfotelmatobacter sp.]|jgi:putative PIN family toxin of toxin-antitoxin system